MVEGAPAGLCFEERHTRTRSRTVSGRSVQLWAGGPSMPPPPATGLPGSRETNQSAPQSDSTRDRHARSVEECVAKRALRTGFQRGKTFFNRCRQPRCLTPTRGEKCLFRRAWSSFRPPRSPSSSARTRRASSAAAGSSTAALPADRRSSPTSRREIRAASGTRGSSRPWARCSSRVGWKTRCCSFRGAPATWTCCGKRGCVGH